MGHYVSCLMQFAVGTRGSSCLSVYCALSQLSELRQRLEQAEADRQELQEELRKEREARENLERTIGQLKQQMAHSGMVGGSPSPPLTPSTGPPNAHSPPSSSSSSFSEAPAAGHK